MIFDIWIGGVSSPLAAIFTGSSWVIKTVGIPGTTSVHASHTFTSCSSRYSPDFPVAITVYHRSARLSTVDLPVLYLYLLPGTNLVNLPGPQPNGDLLSFCSRGSPQTTPLTIPAGSLPLPPRCDCPRPVSPAGSPHGRLPSAHRFPTPSRCAYSSTPSPPTAKPLTPVR